MILNKYEHIGMQVPHQRKIFYIFTYYMVRVNSEDIISQLQPNIYTMSWVECGIEATGGAPLRESRNSKLARFMNKSLGIQITLTVHLTVLFPCLST